MSHLSDETFESVISSLIENDYIDLKDIEFIDPYGMVGLLNLHKKRLVKRIDEVREGGRVLAYEKLSPWP